MRKVPCAAHRNDENMIAWCGANICNAARDTRDTRDTRIIKIMFLFQWCNMTCRQEKKKQNKKWIYIFNTLDHLSWSTCILCTASTTKNRKVRQQWCSGETRLSLLERFCINRIVFVQVWEEMWIKLWFSSRDFCGRAISGVGFREIDSSGPWGKSYSDTEEEIECIQCVCVCVYLQTLFRATWMEGKRVGHANTDKDNTEGFTTRD